jgi:hypothetical protein
MNMSPKTFFSPALCLLALSCGGPTPTERGLAGERSMETKPEAAPQGWYEMRDWPLDWPSGYLILKDTQAVVRVQPDLRAEARLCVLSAGGRYHPWVDTEVLYRQTIVTYRAGEDFTDVVCLPPDGREYSPLDDGRDFVRKELYVQKGELLEELAPLGDGNCVVRAQGMIFPFSCLCLYDAEMEELPGQEYFVEEWFKATCADGHTGWILGAELGPMVADGHVRSMSHDELVDAEAEPQVEAD